MRIQSVAVGAYGTNCYLIEQEGHWMVVDPGDGRNAVLKYLQKEGIRPEKIAVTHGHMDHFADAAEMAETYQISIYFPRKEVGYLHSGLARRGPYDPAVFQAFEEALSNWGVYVEEGDRIQLDTLEFQILILPGHSDAGMCLYEKSQGVVFAGDQLFYRSVGRADLYRGDGEDLLKSIRQKLLTLPEDTVVLPGHGPATRIDQEKAGNPYLNGEMSWGM